MKDAPSTSREDYLKAILEAESEGHPVIPALLAHWVGVSAPAVTMALKRLKRDGMVEIVSGRVQLTTEGRAVAYRTALRHHLIERMLNEIFGMEWHEIHEEAERLEHAVSPAFEAKLMEKLGEDGACPHGNHVLPLSPQAHESRGHVNLSTARPGQRHVVVSLQERDPQLLLFLHNAGIAPGCELTVLEQNYDQTVAVELNGNRSILGRMAAEAVWLRSL